MIDIQRFRPRAVDALRGYSRERLVGDVAAGVTVGIVALPLAMAFAIASGVKPEQGLITAIVAGFLISALGGSNVQIGGPAGAFIVIVYGIIERYGLTNLLIATALAGVLLFALGALKLGGLVRYIPVTIVIGFTNGIAVLIALSQVRDLLGLKIDGKLPADFFAQIGVLAHHAGTFNPYAFGLGVTCVIGLLAWPKLFGVKTPLPVALMDTRAGRMASRLPAPIVALVTLSAAAAILKLPVETIGTRFGGIPSTLPSLDLPPFSWESAKQLVIPTVTIALLGAVESLLCARIADNVSDTPRHDPNQELMAQGIANMVAPAFGGIPATGTIARTVTNVRAGAKTPVAGIVHAICLLVIVLLAAPLAASVPLAVLAGILLVVAWNMAEWHEFARLRKFSLPYAIVMLGTFVTTVVFDLMVAVELGLVLACVFFIWRMAQLFDVEPAGGRSLPPGVQVLGLYGNLFFGAVRKIEELPQRLPAGTQSVVLEMGRLVSMDNSGLDALMQMQRMLARRGIRVVIASPNPQPLSLMRRGHFLEMLGEGGVAADLDEALVALAAVAPA